MDATENGWRLNPNAKGGKVLRRNDIVAGKQFVWYLPKSSESPIRGTFLSEPWYTEGGWMVDTRLEGADHDSVYCLRDMGITCHADGSWSPHVTIAETD